MYMCNQSTHGFYHRQQCKRLFARAVIFVLLLSTIPVASAAGGQGQSTDKALPVFDINKTEHDFGDIFLGESVTVGFTVRNLGAAPLQLAESPIVTGKPTVGVYRRSGRDNLSHSLRDLLTPASVTLGVLPYT